MSIRLRFAYTPSAMSVAHVVIALVFSMDAYWWWLSDRRLRPLRRARIWRGLLALFAGGQMLLLISRLIPPVWARQINGHVPLPLIAGQFLWHLAVLPACLLLGFVGSALRTVFSSAEGASTGGNSSGAEEIKNVESAPRTDLAGTWHLVSGADPTAPQESARGADPTRRQILLAAVAIPPVILAGTTGVSLTQLGGYRVRQLDLRIPGLPPQLDGVTIAHLSDFHAGRFMTRENMLPIIDTVNAMHPDLVLITGDLIDYALIDLPPALDALRRLKPKYGLKDGLAMCMGNHDVIENRFTFKRDTDAAGFPVLANSARTIEVNGYPVQLMAVDWCQGDKRTGEKSKTQMTAAIYGLGAMRDPAAFPILLTHHPHAFDDAAAVGFPLTLAGHTHGGQIMLSERMGAGPVLFKYWSGIYRKPNGSRLVVSNGIGNWFPLRFNAPAEVVKLTLRV